MNAITVGAIAPSGDTAEVEYGLPYADATYDVASFTVNDPTNRNKEYSVDLRIQLGNDGAVHANASLPDQTNFIGVVDDVYHLAQTAYWPTTAPTVATAPVVGANDDDILAATITPSAISGHFASAMEAMESDVNDQANVLASWSISFDAVPHHPGSTLSQYGQVNNLTNDDPFVTGAKIVAQTPKDYHVKVSLEHGSVESLVNEKVYGILEQGTSTLENTAA
jgi:hypothetical protein